MFIYIAISLGNGRSKVNSNIVLGLVSLVFIFSSLYIALSVCGFLNLKATLISLEVIPFLILAIGVDYLFLIYDNIMNVPSNNIELKVAAGLRQVGPSITLSSFT